MRKFPSNGIMRTNRKQTEPRHRAMPSNELAAAASHQAEDLKRHF